MMTQYREGDHGGITAEAFLLSKHDCYVST